MSDISSPLTSEDIQRFWSRVARCPHGHDCSKCCWLWTKGRTAAGYGALQIRHQQFYAHRLAYLLTYGPILPGFFVCHACDVPACCNPHHLWLGTTWDNGRHALRKGRYCTDHAKLSPNARMTPADIRAIRQAAHAGTSTSALAKQFGISQSQVSTIVQYKAWKHIA